MGRINLSGGISEGIFGNAPKSGFLNMGQYTSILKSEVNVSKSEMITLKLGFKI